MKTGRPLQRIPYGTLPCSLGGHLAPYTEFRRTTQGYIDSSCIACKRLHDRVMWAKKARERRAHVG